MFVFGLAALMDAEGTECSICSYLTLAELFLSFALNCFRVCSNHQSTVFNVKCYFYVTQTEDVNLRPDLHHVLLAKSKNHEHKMPRVYWVWGIGYIFNQCYEGCNKYVGGLKRMHAYSQTIL